MLFDTGDASSPLLVKSTGALDGHVDLSGNTAGITGMTVMVPAQERESSISWLMGVLDVFGLFSFDVSIRGLLNSIVHQIIHQLYWRLCLGPNWHQIN